MTTVQCGVAVRRDFTRCCNRPITGFAFAARRPQDGKPSSSCPRCRRARAAAKQRRREGIGMTADIVTFPKSRQADADDEAFVALLIKPAAIINKYRRGTHLSILPTDHRRLTT